MKATIFAVLVLAAGMNLFASEPGSNAEPAAEMKAMPVTFAGTITDQLSGEALTGVKVIIEGSDAVQYTDFEGNFQISNLMPGEYNMTVEYISYDSKKLEKIKINHTTEKLAVKMQPSTVSVKN